MKRRRFAALVTGALAGVSGCSADNTRVFIRNKVDDDEGVDWRVFSAGFDRIEWDGTELIVHFEPDHGMDFFHLTHEYNEDDYETRLYSHEAPDFDGKVRIPFVVLRQESGKDYPTQKFSLVAFKGESGYISEFNERLGSVTFRVPDRVWNTTVIRT